MTMRSYVGESRSPKSLSTSETFFTMSWSRVYKIKTFENSPKKEGGDGT